MICAPAYAATIARRLLGCLAAAAVLLACSASAALAGPVTVSVQDGVIVYQGDDEDNGFDAAYNPQGYYFEPAGSIHIEDQGNEPEAINPGPGCQRGASVFAQPPGSASPYAVYCAGTFERFEVNFGGGRDTATVSLLKDHPIEVSVDGGPGPDGFWGHEGPDSFWGGEGNDGASALCSGNDYAEGGPGDDGLNGSTLGTAGCAGDEVPGGGDTIFGDEGNDTLTANGSESYIEGGDDNDDIYIDPGPGPFAVDAGAGNDTLRGAGAGVDIEMTGGAGQDTFYGNASNDTIDAFDQEEDAVSCAGGTDVAFVDQFDEAFIATDLSGEGGRVPGTFAEAGCEEFGEPEDDIDGDGTPDAADGDVDGDGQDNAEDEDIDGDGEANADDGDMDGDDVADGDDLDVDGDGVGNEDDEDIDGDGEANADDGDMDGDDLEDGEDQNVDGDDLENEDDPDVDGDGATNGEDEDVDGDDAPNDNDPGAAAFATSATTAAAGTFDDSNIDGDGSPNTSDGDMDGDGTGNEDDTDIDGDGRTNSVDPDMDGDDTPNGSDSTPKGTATPDTDGDGKKDPVDNCKNVANPGQVDTDGDKAGNACDADDDNDGVSDAAEAANGTDPLKADTDGDGKPDGSDSCGTTAAASANGCPADPGPGPGPGPGGNPGPGTGPGPGPGGNPGPAVPTAGAITNMRRKVNSRTGTADVSFDINQPGNVSLVVTARVGKRTIKVFSDSAHINEARRVVFLGTTSRAAKKILKRKRSLRVRALATLTPDSGGAVATKAITYTLKLKKKRRARR